MQCVWDWALRPTPQALDLPIPPGHYSNCDDINEVEVTTSSNFHNLAEEVREFGTDGSGGSRAIPSNISRVGAAVSLVQFDWRNLEPTTCGFASCCPPGKQTVNRAEL